MTNSFSEILPVNTNYVNVTEKWMENTGFDREGDHFQLTKERQEIDNLCSSQGAFWHLNLNDMIKTAIAF